MNIEEYEELYQIKYKCIDFINEISTKYIIIEFRDICNFMDRINIKMNIKIPRYNIEFNYGMELPLLKNMFDNKYKIDLVNRIKYDIYQYLVEFIGLDKLGDIYDNN